MPKSLPVLVVEDDENDSLLMQMAVRALNLGWDLHWVTNGQEALDYLDTVNPSELPGGIITDIKMPRKNGLELLRDLAAKPKLVNIPTAIFTSSRLQADITEAMENADGFFTKPGTLREFQSTVKEIDQLFRRLASPR